MLRFFVLLAIAASVVTAVASATPPGKNGRIAFRRYFDQQQTWGAVFTIQPSGKGARQVTHPPKGTLDDQPDWSPDGSHITFARCGDPCRVATIAANGTDLRLLTPNCPLSQGSPDCVSVGGAAYSPDGQLIVYGAASGDVKVFPGGGDQAATVSLVIMDANGENGRTVLQLGDYTGDTNYPQFSPDGKQLVFEQANSRLGNPANSRAVFVVGVDGTGLKRLTPWSMSAGDGPDWSPDGSWILFRSNVEVSGKQSQINVVRPDGTGFKRLTHFKPGTTVLSATFSPDGKWIVLSAAGKAGQPDIYVMRANGTALRPVTRTSIWDSAPDWGSAR